MAPETQATTWGVVMRRFFAGWLVALVLNGSAAWAGNFPGEQPSYTRDVGFETRLFYVASGNGAGKVEYVCKAFAGTTGSDDTSSSVWQVMRLTYDSSNRVSTVAYAGDDDAYNQVCDNRTTLNYN